jgi:exonuclease VII small subunit
MNDKKLLQIIKETPVEHFTNWEKNWLIEQAEKVSRLGLEIEYWKTLWEQAVNEKKEIQQQLQQAQTKIEKYEKALNTIANTSSSSGWYCVEVAKQALEGEVK